MLIYSRVECCEMAVSQSRWSEDRVSIAIAVTSAANHVIPCPAPNWRAAIVYTGSRNVGYYVIFMSE